MSKKNGKPALVTIEPPQEWVPAHIRARAQRQKDYVPTGRHEIDLNAPLELTHTNERVKRALTAIAYFDPRRLTYEDATPRPISELDDDTATALMGLEVNELWGPGEERTREIIGVTKKYRQADRLRALELLAKIPDASGKRLIVEKLEHTGEDGQPLMPPTLTVNFVGAPSKAETT